VKRAHAGGLARHTAKIRPDRRAADLNWHVLGPGDLALGEWKGQGLELPDMDVVREYRLARVLEKLHELGYGGIVLFDPLNARYATSSTNMQIWITHNASRYAFIGADGYVVQFEFSRAYHLSDPFPEIDEVRPATDWYYFAAGNTFDAKAKRWAAEINELLREHGGGNTRLAADKLNPEGVHHLTELGVSVHNGEEVMELARCIKSPEEIKAMRCAMAATEKSMEVMQDHLVPGISEQELWSHLHAESIKRGGEWIETRLLSSGPRTNPWYQECSSRVIERGDLVGFDTDLIGSFGMCVDISRTWLCGDDEATPAQMELFDLAREQIDHSISMIHPGVTFRELTFNSWIPDPETYRHYTSQFHGVGLCDEYPAVFFPEEWETAGYDGVVEAGMVLAVESYVGRKDGGEGVKLEEQLLVTDDGTELLSSYPLGLTR
jgi:Xaa-Pro aminopeptidase